MALQRQTNNMIKETNEKMDMMFNDMLNTQEKPPIKTPPRKLPKRETHKTYTVWIEKEKLAEWKAFVKTKKIKNEDLIIYAVEHYINNVFPLTEKEQKDFESKKKAELKKLDADGRKKG